MRLLIAAGLALACPVSALAHVTLGYPPPRSTEQKAQVCGAAGSTRGANPTVLAPGATIMVMWKETIDHTGHYRISFDVDGQDFIIPATAATNTEGMTNVIDDMIPDIQGGLPVGGRQYMQQITLPMMECNNCTLQLTQLMTDKAPYTTDAASDDIYYQCADITLSNAPANPDAGNMGTMPDAPMGGGGPGGTTTGGCSTTGSGAGLLVGLALLFTKRRRRA